MKTKRKYRSIEEPWTISMFEPEVKTIYVFNGRSIDYHGNQLLAFRRLIVHDNKRQKNHE